MKYVKWILILKIIGYLLALCVAGYVIFTICGVV